MLRSRRRWQGFLLANDQLVVLLLQL